MIVERKACILKNLVLESKPMKSIQEVEPSLIGDDAFQFIASKGLPQRPHTREPRECGTVTIERPKSALSAEDIILQEAFQDPINVEHQVAETPYKSTEHGYSKCPQTR